MKYSIIIPTYIDHINQVDLFLSSFNNNALDKYDIPIKLIISKNEIPIFNNIITKYSLNIELITLNQILNDIEGVDLNEIDLLNRFQKFNFQSIKKLYGVKYVGSEISLVLDSEALLIRKTEFKTIFESYLKHRVIFHSKHHKRDSLQLQVTNNVFKMLNSEFEDMWLFDYQSWFFEKDIVDNLFKYFDKKSIFNLLYSVNPIFEYNLYSAFIYLYNRNNYEFVDVDNLLQSKMGLDYQNYINSSVAGTAFEYFSWNLSDKNINIFSDIFKQYDLSFFKYDDRFLNNEKIQQRFIEENNQIKMLVCRVVCQEFKINDFKIPINHDCKNNRPI